MKNLWGFIQQYIVELLAMVLFVWGVCGFIYGSDNWLFILLSVVFWLIFSGLFYLIFTFVVIPLIIIVNSKKRGKLLSLSWRNEIGMMGKNFDDATYFLEDIEKIISFAKTKGIGEMKTTTHRVLVLYFLKEYTSFASRQIYEMILKMNVNDVLVLNTSFGKVKVIYVGKEINNCNRYDKNKKGWLKRVFQQKDTYKLTLFVEGK